MKQLWIQNKRYFLYDTYSTREKAYEIAKKYKKKNNSKFFIVEVERGYLFPYRMYELYLTKVMRLT